MTYSVRNNRGWSIIEVLVSLAVFLFGVASIAMYFPYAITAKADAAYKAKAVFLAQRKAHEIRRDNTPANPLVEQIQQLTNPTDPVSFADEPNLAYQLNGVSLIDPSDDPDDPRDDRGVARVIVRYAGDFRSSQDILYELRFDGP